MVSDTHPGKSMISSSLQVSPFSQLGLHLSDTDLRETAFEIFIAASTSQKGGRPLNYVSSSYSSSGSSMQKLTPPSKVKKVWGLKPAKNLVGNPQNSLSSTKRVVTIGEVMRVQMRISEEFDSRFRRALLRITAGQVILINLLPIFYIFISINIHIQMCVQIQTNSLQMDIFLSLETRDMPVRTDVRMNI